MLAEMVAGIRYKLEPPVKFDGRSYSSLVCLGRIPRKLNQYLAFATADGHDDEEENFVLICTPGCEMVIKRPEKPAKGPLLAIAQ